MNKELCPSCHGAGGWDLASDPEVYDNWQECGTCGGTGEIDE